MRGAFSFLYAFAALASVLFLYSAYARMDGALSSSEHQLLLLEDRHAREMEIKRAVTDTVRYSVIEALSSNPLATSDEMRDRIGESLAGLKDLESTGNSSYYNIRRFALRFWCGSPSEQALIASIDNRSWFNRTDGFICDGCHPIDEWYPLVNPSNGATELKRTCALYLTIDPISKSVHISHPDSRAISLLSGSEPAIGVMVYDSLENVSSVVLVPFSTEISWADPS